MIQIYSPNNANYDKNGDMTLFPMSCEIHAELNSMWDLQITHPVDDEGRWKYIVEGAVLSVPFGSKKNQLYRIYSTENNETTISASARPIFFDAADEVFIRDKRPTNKVGQEALDILFAGQTKYSGSSNITKESTAYYVNKNLIEAIQGSGEESFVNRWGGQVFYDNFNITINSHIGNGIPKKIENGLKRDGIVSMVNMDNVATRLIPFGYDGIGLSGDAYYVDSPNINKYPKMFIKTVEFPEVRMKDDSSTPDEGTILCETTEQFDAALIRKCQELYESGIDLPERNYSIPLIDLASTEEYKDIKGLEKLQLGDDVIYVDEYGIEITEHIIAVTYDCLNDVNLSVEIGNFKANYINELESALERVNASINNDGTVKAEQVTGIIDGIRTKMRVQASEAHPQAVRAIIFEDLNPGSSTYGAMCIGTMGFQIAHQRTADGKEWDWRTFGTGSGFYADMMVAGTMLFDRCSGGTLRLGGQGNANGLLQILSAAGAEIGRWDNSGISLTNGVFKSADYAENASGMKIDVTAKQIESYMRIGDSVAKCMIKNSEIAMSKVGSENEFCKMNFANEGGAIVPYIRVKKGDMRTDMSKDGIRIIEGEMLRRAGIFHQDGVSWVLTDNIWLQKTDSIVRAPGGDGITKKVKLPGGAELDISCGIVVGATDAAGKTGRADFSDGSYLTFNNGILTGGSTSEGGAI